MMFEMLVFRFVADPDLVLDLFVVCFFAFIYCWAKIFVACGGLFSCFCVVFF